MKRNKAATIVTSDALDTALHGAARYSLPIIHYVSRPFPKLCIKSWFQMLLEVDCILLWVFENNMQNLGGKQSVLRGIRKEN